MEINELTQDEELALIGLLKAVIQADGEMSFVEKLELSRIGKMMGPDRFHERVERAKEIFKTKAQIRAFAETIERQPARQLIYDLLMEMARQDWLVPEEKKLLEWLSASWKIGETGL